MVAPPVPRMGTKCREPLCWAGLVMLYRESFMRQLQTKRLDLIALSAAQLRFYLEQPSFLEQELGFPISRTIITERVQRAIRMKLARMAHVEDKRLAWYTYWLLVIRGTPPFGAGLIGFKGFPDQAGEAEIGYGIDPDYQRKGYTTEAVQRMIAWAFEEAACMSVVARDTKKSNVASLRILAKLGMTVYDESEDAYWLKVERENFNDSSS
jgi:ribosomal-protein-alanine N-acetyltransferase